MEVAGSDERTRLMMLRKHPGRRCLHCGQAGHEHTGCPRRPCYICGGAGHLAPACPHRRRPLASAERAAARLGAHFAMRAHLRRAELGQTDALLPALPSPQLGARVHAVIERAHERRVTALEWHPGGRLLASGSKRGEISLTDLGARGSGSLGLDARVAKTHPVFVSALAFDDSGGLWSSSMDGCVRRSAIEREFSAGPARARTTADTLLNLNPAGWTPDMTPARWNTINSLTLDRRCAHAAFAVSNKGGFHVVDARASHPVAEYPKMHRAKIQFVEANPARPELLISCANDRVMALWDARRLGAGCEVGFYTHPKIPYAASFAPHSGARVVSTCHDNRVRVWGDVNSLSGNANEREDGAPREIVHSHNFNRYLSPFRAHWDPKDWTDDLFLVGRFLGDAYSVPRGEHGDTVEKLLHPIDLFSARKADVVASIIDFAVPTKCPLNKFNPVRDVIVSGTSLHLAFWAPRKEDAERSGERDAGRRPRGRRRRGGGDNDDDDDDDGGGGGPRKKKKTIALRKKKSAPAHGHNTRSQSAAGAS